MGQKSELHQGRPVEVKERIPVYVVRLERREENGKGPFGLK
jgi:hypothetical protein